MGQSGRSWRIPRKDNGHGPWSRPPSGKPPISNRLWIALGVAALVSLVIFALSTLFPDALATDMDQARLLRLAGALALVSSGVIVSRRFERRDTLRNIAIWCGIFAVLILGYTFRDSFESVGEKVVAELIPNSPVETGAHEITLTASEDGSFYAAGYVNEARANFLIDTGASSIVLSPADASRAGIDVARLDYNESFGSAHGDGRGAFLTIDRLAIGPIELGHVPVIVNASPMRTSLLGLTFLQRLKSFHFEGRKLTLRWGS